MQAADVAEQVHDHLPRDIRGVVRVPDRVQCGAQDPRGGLERRRKGEKRRTDAAEAAKRKGCQRRVLVETTVAKGVVKLTRRTAPSFEKRCSQPVLRVRRTTWSELATGFK